jgi:hypothetical protein
LVAVKQSVLPVSDALLDLLDLPSGIQQPLAVGHDGDLIELGREGLLGSRRTTFLSLASGCCLDASVHWRYRLPSAAFLSLLCSKGSGNSFSKDGLEGGIVQIE